METWVSLEELWAERCVKLRSILRLERPTNLRKLCVRGCSVLEELEGVEHTAKRLDVSK